MLTFFYFHWSDTSKEIKKRNDLWMKSYNDKNFESFGSVYAADCKLMAPGTTIKLGREGYFIFYIDLYTISCAF